MNGRVELGPADAVDVTIVVDNFLDVLMPSTEIVRRAPLVWDWSERDTLVAEHARDGWEPDTWLWDDQPMVLNLKDKGLIVLSCCSHAGIINVLRHAQRITGIQKVYAVVGGLHLTGGLFEPIILRTVEELAAIGPEVIVPCHCTGWKATHELARRLPEAYVQTSVGTRLHFA